MSSKSFTCQSSDQDYIRIENESGLINFMVREAGTGNYVNLNPDQVREMITYLQSLVGEGVAKHQSQPMVRQTPLDGFANECAVSGTRYSLGRIPQSHAYVLRVHDEETQAIILNVVQMRELRDAIQRMIGHLDGFFESEASHG